MLWLTHNPNRSQQRPESGHYKDINKVFRPSHADFTYQENTAEQSRRRASAKETIGRVAAGAVAEQILATFTDFECIAFVDKVKDVRVSNLSTTHFVILLTKLHLDAQILALIVKWKKSLYQQRKTGTVSVVVFFAKLRVFFGLGEPIFDKLQADLAKALMSLLTRQTLRLVLVLKRRKCWVQT